MPSAGFIGSGDVERRLWFVEAAALTVMALAVMWSRVEARRTRASLTRLVVELAEASEGGLKTLLARTLDDDTLEIAYPVGADRFADATGAAIDLPPRDGRAATAIVRDGATGGRRSAPAGSARRCRARRGGGLGGAAGTR